MPHLSNVTTLDGCASEKRQHTPETRESEQEKLRDQTRLLSGWPLIRIFMTLSTAQFITFMDQVSITMLIPSMAVDLEAQGDIAWVGTASLMAMTAFSPLWGRGSDLFGRKNGLLGLLVILGLSSVGCAVAQNFSLLCASRVFAGIANGGISSLVQMMVSDHVTLRERGKYQGILGTMVGAGSVLGVICSSLLDMHYSWRYHYYLQIGLVMFVFAICWFNLPSYKPTLTFREMLAELDTKGLFSIIAAVVLILVATSQGVKSETPWNSPTIISLYTSGCTCLVAFLIIEWRWAKKPIIPLKLLRNRSIAAMLVQTFLLGATYHISNYYLQLYLQNVLDYSPFKSALLQMSLPIVQSVSAPIAGLLQTRWDSYLYIHLFGFSMWTIGAGLLVACNEHTHPALICFIVTLIGIGVGCVLQPTLVALQAHCSKKDRAVIISSRNFLRNCGGACGLAVSSTVATKTFTATLPKAFRHVISSTFAAPNLKHLPATERGDVRDSCQAAIRMVFVFSLSLIALCPMLCALVKDNGLTRPEEKEAMHVLTGGTEEMAESGTGTMQSEPETKAPADSDTEVSSTASRSSVLDNSASELLSRRQWRVSLKNVWSIFGPTL